MNVVLDTRVLGAGVLSPHGPSAAVLRSLLTERVQLCFDERVLAEYREVLTDRSFAIDSFLLEELLAFLEAAGVPTLAPPAAPDLPDPSDQALLEVAKASAADFLIAADVERFPAEASAGLRIITSRDFIEVLVA